MLDLDKRMIDLGVWWVPETSVSGELDDYSYEYSCRYKLGYIFLRVRRRSEMETGE